MLVGGVGTICLLYLNMNTLNMQISESLEPALFSQRERVRWTSMLEASCQAAYLPSTFHQCITNEDKYRNQWQRDTRFQIYGMPLQALPR